MMRRDYVVMALAAFGCLRPDLVAAQTDSLKARPSEIIRVKISPLEYMTADQRVHLIDIDKVHFPMPVEDYDASGGFLKVTIGDQAAWVSEDTVVTDADAKSNISCGEVATNRSSVWHQEAASGVAGGCGK